MEEKIMIPTKKLNFLKKNIEKNCSECLGDGCFECKKKASRMMKYADAGIPIDYWLLPFKSFSGDPNFKEAVSARIRNIDGMYANGESLGFVGNLGTGKTYAACCILKKAIVSGYDANYVNMADVVNGLISKSSDNEQYLKELMEIDFLVIDEFDKRWVFPSEKVEQLFGQTLEHILRSRFQNQMPTILCSNTENIDDVLSDDFSRAFSSLRHKYMKVFIVAGRDFRKCQ
jgi:DNA replication protein DnaC